MNLQNNGGGGAPVVIVRGVGLQSFRINDSPTTAFYVDDVYQTSVASAEWTMFDLERVEVLKGPQGGLYGRNALGGAIQIISRTPSVDEANNGYVSLGFEEYSREELEAAASFGIGDKFAIRIAGRDVGGSDAPYRSVHRRLRLRRRGSRRGASHVADLAERHLRHHAPPSGGSDDSQLEPLRPVGVYANIGTLRQSGRPSRSALLGGLTRGDPEPAVRVDHERGRRRSRDVRHCARA